MVICRGTHHNDDDDDDDDMSGDNNLYILAGAVTAVSVLVAAYSLFARSNSGGRAVLKKDEFQEFPLVQKTVLSHNSAVYRFGLPRPNDILGLPIGQHVSIAAQVEGKEIVRSYTPTSSDDEKGYFDLLIKTYPTGNVSKHVGNLNIGDSIRVRGPKGQFTYSRGLVRAFGMVAGGTGITPMYQIVQAIAKDPNDHTEVHLVFANVNYEDILLKKELDDLAAKHDNINVYYVLNNPPEKWQGGVGFVTADILKEHVPAPAADVKLLMCGPPPMISAVKKAAVDIGFQKAKPVSKLEDQVFAF